MVNNFCNRYFCHDKVTFTCHKHFMALNESPCFRLDWFKENILWSFSEPPSIITPETEITIVRNDDETIQCLVDGLPTPEITWFKNGVEIERISHPNLRMSPNKQVLTIYQAQVGFELVISRSQIRRF